MFSPLYLKIFEKSPFLMKTPTQNFAHHTEVKKHPFGVKTPILATLPVWPESLGPKTPKGNLKTPKKNTTLKTKKHHVFGYKNTKYLIKSFKNGPPKHFYCIFVHQFLKNFNFSPKFFKKFQFFF